MLRTLYRLFLKLDILGNNISINLKGNGNRHKHLLWTILTLAAYGGIIASTFQFFDDFVNNNVESVVASI